MKPILFVLIPCYNEEEIIDDTADAVKNKIVELINNMQISSESRIIFINDGSGDSTQIKIENIINSNNIFGAIQLSRNFGHQNALLAGLIEINKLALADIVISIDADLQQDINAIDQFIQKWKEGNDIVYGVRKSRNTDGFFKKLSATFFYRIMGMFGCHIISNHADYRLVSKRALSSLSEFGEVNLFLRGLFPLLGYKSDVVYFDVFERKKGKSKYNLQKMFFLGINGITSFSVTPIRIITFIGFMITAIGIGIVIFSLFSFYQNKNISGWTSLISSIWLLGGVNMLSIGIIGEYIGKTYLETKRRPRYIIAKIDINRDR